MVAWDVAFLSLGADFSFSSAPFCCHAGMAGLVGLSESLITSSRLVVLVGSDRGDQAQHWMIATPASSCVSSRAEATRPAEIVAHRHMSKTVRIPPDESVSRFHTSLVQSWDLTCRY